MKSRLFDSADYADIKTVGIPRALLYYRYGQMWTTFFEGLGCTVVLSDETDKKILGIGDSLSIDESCLASKVYMGHVQNLIGKCDAIFIPSITCVNRFERFCTKFQSLPDMVENTFQEDFKILSFAVDETNEKNSLKKGFMELAQKFGASPKKAKKLAEAVIKAQEKADEKAGQAQQKQLKRIAALPKEERPLVILVVAHLYIVKDWYLGGVVSEILSGMGVEILFADETDSKKAREESYKFSKTMPWLVNRELIGSIMLLQKDIDGIVVMSAFPCGPDSMTTDAIMRKVQGTPLLNVTIDAQSGTAGLETRIESFVDILRCQKQGGYVR
ncbi:MAG: acyl-CoA dehydratase activase-related protein [Anaerotardibacter sp.]